ncbi:hypothetical protein V5O48_001651 [Marasmius crinis-equi]|uniref:Protein MEMO1 n=1 Tax=Marasmius crinis-equi TaxID=585013 RepID=A0ABR3FYF8_9AGAR
MALPGSTLNSELSGWLQDVQPTDEAFPIKGCKAVIAPSVELWRMGMYEFVDVNLAIRELDETGKFETFSLDDDEAEHSLEMHLPYIRKIFEGKDITIVPIVVGAISKSSEAAYGTILAPYLAKEDTLFVISSDFCHWGTRFSYTFYYPEPKPSEAPGIRLSRSTNPSSEHPIHESIRRLDHEATAILTIPPSTAAEAHDQFSQYLSKTKNTICGRHPIGVLLGALAALETPVTPSIKWVRYAQSSACETIRDSSVSYASAWMLSGIHAYDLFPKLNFEQCGALSSEYSMFFELKIFNTYALRNGSSVLMVMFGSDNMRGVLLLSPRREIYHRSSNPNVIEHAYTTSM